MDLYLIWTIYRTVHFCLSPIIDSLPLLVVPWVTTVSTLLTYLLTYAHRSRWSIGHQRQPPSHSVLGCSGHSGPVGPLLFQLCFSVSPPTVVSTLHRLYCIIDAFHSCEYSCESYYFEVECASLSDSTGDTNG